MSARRFSRVCDQCGAWSYFSTREECLDRCARRGCRLDLCDGCMADAPCDGGGSHASEREHGPGDDDAGPSGTYAEHVPGLPNGRP